MTLGTILSLQHFYFTLIAILIVLPLIFFKTKAEEKLLMAQFSEEYRKYKSNVSMFFPFKKLKLKNKV